MIIIQGTGLRRQLIFQTNLTNSPNKSERSNDLTLRKHAPQKTCTSDPSWTEREGTSSEMYRCFMSSYHMREAPLLNPDPISACSYLTKLIFNAVVSLEDTGLLRIKATPSRQGLHLQPSGRTHCGVDSRLT